MGLKAKIEAIIYAAEEPITLEQISLLVKDAVLAEATAERARAAGAEQVEQAAAGGAPAEAESAKADTARIKDHVRPVIAELIADYERGERGIEIRQVAGGFRMATKPEHHDVVRAFAKSLKPPVRLSIPALETLAVIAYKQPVTVPEITEIRGVESAGVIGTLLDRKLITTAGRKQVIGRPILYKTSKEFLLRFGLNDLAELPSMEEFEKLALDQSELFTAPAEASASNSEAKNDDADGDENARGVDDQEQASSPAKPADEPPIS